MSALIPGPILNQVGYKFIFLGRSTTGERLWEATAPDGTSLGAEFLSRGRAQDAAREHLRQTRKLTRKLKKTEVEAETEQPNPLSELVEQVPTGTPPAPVTGEGDVNPKSGRMELPLNRVLVDQATGERFLLVRLP